MGPSRSAIKGRVGEQKVINKDWNLESRWSSEKKTSRHSLNEPLMLQLWSEFWIKYHSHFFRHWSTDCLSPWQKVVTLAKKEPLITKRTYAKWFYAATPKGNKGSLFTNSWSQSIFPDVTLIKNQRCLDLTTITDLKNEISTEKCVRCCDVSSCFLNWFSVCLSIRDERSDKVKRLKLHHHTPQPELSVNRLNFRWP